MLTERVKYPVPFDFEEHRRHMAASSRALWKQYIRELKERKSC
ncbi:hypothetical protein NVP1104O_58 [Vibrio phage 1.104.O._10N.286.49.A12]|nr:hypothetical protein NVP1104O_58 [Vibrio phage 1.104.O._10N.286.49.A12]